MNDSFMCTYAIVKNKIVEYNIVLFKHMNHFHFK